MYSGAHEDVLRLEIAVHDPTSVHRLNGGDQRRAARLQFGQRHPFGQSGEPIGKDGQRHQLHRQIRPPVGKQSRGQELGHVWRAHHAQRDRLAMQAVAGRRVGRGNLDRQRRALLVARQIDRAEPAPAQQLLDGVPRQLRRHGRRGRFLSVGRSRGLDHGAAGVNAGPAAPATQTPWSCGGVHRAESSSVWLGS
jgi:hypothetical protein